MKKMLTKDFYKYILTISIITIVFRISLSSLLIIETWNFIFIPPLGYFLLMFLSGWYFGKKDYEYLPFNDIGFRYNLSTFLVFFTISYSMFFLGQMSKYEPRIIIDYTFLIWGIVLTLHLIFYNKVKSNNIKGLPKEDIFD